MYFPHYSQHPKSWRTAQNKWWYTCQMSCRLFKYHPWFLAGIMNLSNWFVGHHGPDICSQILVYQVKIPAATNACSGFDNSFAWTFFDLNVIQDEHQSDSTTVLQADFVGVEQFCFSHMILCSLLFLLQAPRSTPLCGCSAAKLISMPWLIVTVLCKRVIASERWADCYEIEGLPLQVY